MKPLGQSPSKNARECSGPYGGVWVEQAMYYHKKEGGEELALLWPWQSGTLTTVKIIKK